MAEETIQDILAGLLKRYAEKPAELSVDEFLRQEMAANGLQAEEIERSIKAMSEVIASNNENYRSIQQYKDKGLTSAAWLRDTIDRETASFKGDDRDAFIAAMRTGLNKSARSLLGDAAGEPAAPPPGLWEDENKNRLADSLMEQIRENALGRSAALGSALSKDGAKEEGNDR